MIQINLPMSVTATAKLESNRQAKQHQDTTAETTQPPPLQLSDVVMAKSEESTLLLKKQSSMASSSSSTHATSSSSSFSSTSSFNDEDAASSPCTSSSNKNLWYIHGQAYRLQDFVERHPGGKEAILLGKGRDCTALVESYHPFMSSTVWQVLEKYRVEEGAEEGNDDEGEDASMQSDDITPTQQQQQQQQQLSKEEDVFYQVLKDRVQEALRAKGVDPVSDRGASSQRVLYYACILAAWIYTGYLHLSGSIFGSFAFAITGWLMGALGHDAGHFAASRSPWINEWGVWAMSFICNPILWQHQHTYGHHSFTNDFDHDPDLHHFDKFIRVHKQIRYQSQFKYQSNWLYVMFAYLWVVFGTCFYIPWGMLSSGTLYGIVDWSDQDRPSKSIGMKVHMALYIIIVAVVPLCTHQSLGAACLSIYLHVATLGLTFALFSQINHLNEHSLQADMSSRNDHDKETDSPFSSTKVDLSIKNSWAATQVETSNNFASRSLFWHVLSNGLNHQIEHHLFPGLNHCHLYLIAPIVKTTCEEFGVNYKSYDTWSDLMTATLDWFGKLSVDEDFDRIKSKSE